MKGIELLLPNPDPGTHPMIFLSSGYFACATCREIWRGQQAADMCCTCGYCGLPTPHRHSAHEACREAEGIRRSGELLEAAQKLDAWDGHVYVYPERYFASVDACRAELEDELPEGADSAALPEFVFVCRTMPFDGADADTILHNICVDGPDDMGDHLRGVDELYKAVAAFNAANASQVSYHLDHTRAVRLRPATPTATPDSNSVTPGA